MSPPAERVRAAGLRATRPRLAVLAWLDDVGGHRSAEDVRHGLARRGVSLPRGSVYNVLTDLVEAGLVLEAPVGPGTSRYEAASEAHHHFVCRVCERVLDVPCDADAGPCLDLHVPGARVEQAEVVLRGRCARCVDGGA